MSSLNAAILVNLLGFSVGAALYALLGLMVMRSRGTGSDIRLLLICTAILGFVWNVGELIIFAARDFSSGTDIPILTAASYSALGFLPSVVVYSARVSGRAGWLISALAFAVSLSASALHFSAAAAGRPVPSGAGLMLLTIGALTLTAALFIVNSRQTIENKAIWASALLIFALSGLHLGFTRESNYWPVELIAHQSSLPLALAILYQNYRFAFADLFLKRAISVMLLALLAFGLYLGVAAPILRFHEAHERDDVQVISLILVLWMATALAYPLLHRAASWLVDRVILRRANYDSLQAELAAEFDKLNAAEDILAVIRKRLGDVLTAGRAEWSQSEKRGAAFLNVSVSHERAEVALPTVTAPFHTLLLEDLQGGRRLLSDETAMLEAVANAAARRIDALRVIHERYELELRERESSKLAAEARLSALRAQINPHFLFNALTTIGYLIESSPAKAFQTLLHLTRLLRVVLNAKDEFCTLGDELRLIENYLDIELARFEERLKVNIDVPVELERSTIPAFVLQPLVENAIKHGVAELSEGGEVRIEARQRIDGDSSLLEITVTDTGDGSRLDTIDPDAGVGLKNIEGRLRTYYGERAVLSVRHVAGSGTNATIVLPLVGAEQTVSRSKESVKV